MLYGAPNCPYCRLDDCPGCDDRPEETERRRCGCGRFFRAFAESREARCPACTPSNVLRDSLLQILKTQMEAV